MWSLFISPDGTVSSPWIKVRISSNIEGKPMSVIQGIIVHQTDSPTAKSTFSSYARPKANGAHFLIDKDGTIYQTASVFKQTRHVGKLNSLCYQRHSCSPVDLAKLKVAMAIRSPGKRASAIHNIEKVKSIPDRFPSNEDSIGIEIVGKAIIQAPKREVFERVNAVQNTSLKWLVDELTFAFGVPSTQIYRHPVVSIKNPTEASTAVWQ